MAKDLVIVESPTKVKTIKKFLGKNYEVVASLGHVRDLPKSQMGIEIENDFEPKYITIRGKGELLSALRKKVKKADEIYLATDPDREGEAISWHLFFALKLAEQKDKKVYRIAFNEITKNAVKEAIKNHREIDMNLVDAQQARRVLDRLVGYNISPLLWAKVKRGLSAGRVQSAALRIISDREDEINAFIPKEFYTIDVTLSHDKNKKIKVSFFGENNKKLEITDKDTLKRITKEIEKNDFFVSSIKQTKKERKSPNPFTTSTMQQEAVKTLNFSTQKTMRVAQQLYEGINIKGKGQIGLITYLRTDSTRISNEAKQASINFISENYGKEFVNIGEKYKKTGRNVQDAHEAIRPTNIEILPSEIKDSLTRDQFKLYNLIWKRFVASQMQAAIFSITNVKISCGKLLFSGSVSKVTFEGFRLIYKESSDEGVEKNNGILDLSEKSKLKLVNHEEIQHFTNPPAHFTEASLVKILEDNGIGRPSTYAPTIATLLKRRYVTKESKNLYMTEIGETVNNIMKDSFPNIVNTEFTADMEGLLDKVEEGEIEWKSIIRDFYPDFKVLVEKAEKELEKVQIKDEETDIVCENCGRHMVIKYGPHGKFLACPGFPDCRNTKPYIEKIGVKCPLCHKEIVLRKTKKGRKFYGCENYPECNFISWQKPLDKACPKCNRYMVLKGKKIACSDKECGYTEDYATVKK